MNLKKNKNRPVNVQKRSVSESAADCRLHGSQETSEQAAAAAQRGSVHTAKEAHGAPRHLPYCTGAQAIQVLHNLKENFCYLDAVLIMKDFPSTMAPRVFHGSFDLRPSNTLLIQAYMSKQIQSKDYLPLS